MIKNNYHTHTIRCGHASGEDEEFVLEAIALGLTEIGFADHIMLPDHSQIGIRGDYSLLDDYIDSLNKLKEKYKEKIKIHIGFEAEGLVGVGALQILNNYKMNSIAKPAQNQTIDL